MSDLIETGRIGNLLVTFEGGEGAGKSTQVQRLKNRLQALGMAVLTTREPGGSPRAETIRDFLLAGKAKSFGPLGETMLFAAARADHVAVTIRPALERGTTVLCDRFTDSTRVYQGMLDAVPPATVLALEDLAVQGVRPDLTLIFDVPAELGLERAAARRADRRESADRFEQEGLAFHQGVRQAFLAIAAAEPERCEVIRASNPPDDVEEDVWRAVKKRLSTDDIRNGVTFGT